MPDDAAVDAAGDSAGYGRLAVAFARVLRGLGVDVDVGSTMLYAQALALLGLSEREGVYWAGRATLVRRPEHHDAYDRAFAAFWVGRGEGRGVEPAIADVVLGLDAALAGPDIEEEPVAGAAPVVPVRWSPAEVLRRRDFATYTPAELAEARRLMADLRFAGAMRRSRRMVRSGRARGVPDVRRTVRASLRSAGEPIRRAFLEPGERRRPLVLLLDVSGSMEPYARAFVRFLHAAVASRGRVEAFALGTRLTRVTRDLRSRDPDAAVGAAARRVADWSGGTRLGECMREFNDTWGIRGMARGAVVVVLSDGWDRGDPALLAEQMARLRRVAHRVVWVNPLKASPGFAPLAGGMAAALPHVDDFVEGHSIEALDRLAEVMSR